MAYFPFFIDIKDKTFLIVGGGKIAYHKVKILLQFHADITVIAPDVCKEIIQLMESRLSMYKEFGLNEIEEVYPITIINREFLDKDIEEADFVIAATNDEKLNTRISNLCKKENKLVNVVDVKEECSYIFPAIVKKEDLVIAISTEGNSPSVAAKLKTDINHMIPDYYGEFSKLLGQYRAFIKKEVILLSNRKRVYKELMLLVDTKKENVTYETIKNVVKKYKDKNL